MTRQDVPPSSNENGRPRRTGIWALVAAAGILLIYVLNGIFMPVVDTEQQAAWATGTAEAELGISAADATLAPNEEGAAVEATSGIAAGESGSTSANEEEGFSEAETSVDAPTEIPAEAVAEASTEAPDEAPTEAPTETPTDTPAPTDTPTATSTPRPTNSPTPAPTQVPARINGLPTILYDELPPQAHDTIALIDEDGPFPFDRDGITFQNREGLLPQEPRGYYREYTVITPGENDRGARRIIEGEDGELYYTDDHYDSFSYVVR